MMFSYNDLAEKFDIYFYRRLLEHLSVFFFQKKFLSSRCTRTSSASTQTVYCRNAP